MRNAFDLNRLYVSRMYGFDPQDWGMISFREDGYSGNFPNSRIGATK